MQSCRHMADARSLDYNPSLLPASHATIKILEIMTRMTSVETPNGHFRRFAVGDAGLILDAVECGSSYGLHTQCCFYLSHAAPCDITVVDSAHAVEREHGEHSIALKGRLAPAATTLSSFLEPKLFTLLNAPADTEVFVCAAKDDGPLAVFNISVSPPRIQLIMDSSAAADTAVRLILKTGEHFQRLFGPNRAEVTVGMLMDLGPTRDQPFSVVPKPAPCLVGRITEWADSFCQKWRAAFPPPRGDNSDAPPNPPNPPHLSPPADSPSSSSLHTTVFGACSRTGVKSNGSTRFVLNSWLYVCFMQTVTGICAAARLTRSCATLDVPLSASAVADAAPSRLFVPASKP